MANKIDLLLLSLRYLGKAHKRLSRAVPDVKTAEANADKALKKVIELLEDSEIKDLINGLIPGARDRLIEAQSDFYNELETRRPELVSAETNVIQKTGAKKQNIKDLYLRYRDVHQYREKFPLDAATLRQSIIDLHESIKAQLAKSRTLARKKKKKRKRKLVQAIVSAIFGTGVIAADALLPALFTFSYALGGGALHQALRDIVDGHAD